MFSRMFGYKSESYTDTPETIGTKQIQAHFQTPQNTNIYTNDPNVPLTPMTETVNTQFTKEVPILIGGQLKTKLSGNLLAQRQSACEGSGSGDQFDHLVSLESGFNPSSQLRCGWIYDIQNPNNGRGALGTKEGPYKSPVKGVWMWDLTTAKEKFHTSICDKVKNCEDLETYPYKGRCGWCASSGKGIPIFNNRVAYPLNPNTSCSDTDLIVTTSSCPYATPAGQKWKYLPNGRLPRDALIEKAEQSGCSDSGTLIQALRSGSDTNYLDTLMPTKAFSVYQERATVGLNVNALKTGDLTIKSALDEFNRVNELASSSVETGLRYAARDLCIKKGIINEFDFCTEILDSTRGPYSVDCLQKEFLRSGGKTTGTMYPSAENMPTWNSQATWFNVKTLIKKIHDDTLSSNNDIQDAASMMFYGTHVEKPKAKLPAIPGVEVFWFSHPPNQIVTDPTIFLGRRIRPKIPFINQSNDLKGAINRDLVSMVFFTNYVYSQNAKVKFRVTSDDGFGVEFNRALGINYKNALTVNNTNSLISLGYFPPTTFTTTSPWNITTSGPNLLSGYWFQAYGQLYFKLEYQRTDASWSEISPDNLNLTQETYAPMISFEVYREPQTFGADFNFADKRMGGLKMKWISLTGTPTWVYSDVELSVVKFREDSSMKLLSPFKIYSFMTMAVLLRFDAVPNNSVNMNEIISMPGNLGKIAIRIVGTGTYGQATVQLYTEGGGDAARTTTVKTVRQGQMYLLVLRVNRTSESDIYSVNGVSVGIQELGILQSSPSSLEYSAQVTFSNPRAFSNPDTMESRTMIIGNGYISIGWVRLYDYYLNSDGIQREANDSWLRM